jgi:hypothetical protein
MMQLARFLLSASTPRFAESLVRCVLCFLIVCFAICGSVIGEDALTANPLATTAVQTIAAPEPTNDMPPNVAINLYQPPQDTSLANYSRGIDGQWRIPSQVDSTNPSVKLLVLGPQQPTLIEIAIFLEGEPFTAAREKLIDGLLDHATVESLVREAVNVPVPEDTANLSLEEEKNEEGAEDKESESETLGDETVKKDESQEKEAESSDNSSKEDTDKSDTETKTAEKDAEKKENSETKSAEKEKPKEPEKPVVDVKTRQARSVAQRLVNYMASSEVKADREEIRWLLAEWTGGPALLTLGPAMNWQRIGFAPMWNALDMDSDQNLSAAEIAAASERLSQADVDENSIVELEELFELQPRTATAPHSYPLLMVLDHETDWRHLYSQLQAAYGRRMTKTQGSPASSTPALLERIASGDPTLTPEDLEVLLSQEADIKLRVTLGGEEKNEVALLSAQPESFTSDDQTVTVVRGAEYFEISASEQKGAEASEPTATQIAIGAVVDGYPLFRLVDRNGDRRISPRERRNMAGILKALDLNGDGQITENEKPTAIRLAVTRGPHVHEVLAQPTAAHRELASTRQSSPAKPNAAAPSWFSDMDRNRDGDLSRSEFLGTSEQFKQMDADGDGLIGSQEAAK